MAAVLMTVRRQSRLGGGKAGGGGGGTSNGTRAGWIRQWGWRLFCGQTVTAFFHGVVTISVVNWLAQWFWRVRLVAGTGSAFGTE